MFSTLTEHLNSTNSNRLNEMLNEAFGDIDAVRNDIVKLIGRDNCYVDKTSGIVYSYIACPKSVIDYVAKVAEKGSQSIHSIQFSFRGPRMIASQEMVKADPQHREKYCGTITFITLGRDIARKVDPAYNIYHVTSKKNLDSILKNGLIPSQAQWSSNDVSHIKDLEMFTLAIYPYKATFALLNHGQAKKVAKDLEIKDPVMITFKPGKATFYNDSLYNLTIADMVSFKTLVSAHGEFAVYTNDVIPPENIVKYKEL